VTEREINVAKQQIEQELNMIQP